MADVDGRSRTAAALLAEQRAEVTARLAALQREFDGIVSASGQAGTDDEHDPEGATVAYERQHVAALIGAAGEQLAQVEAALARLADGGYGICAACGEPIGADRLAARPAAATCVRCASRRRG